MPKKESPQVIDPSRTILVAESAALCYIVPMKNNRWAKSVKPVADGGRHQCEAGYCRERACIDYGSHVRIVGIPDDCRYLCHEHAKGLKRHNELHAEAR